MQASKQSEPNLVVWNLRLRARLAPLSGFVAVCALVPFLAGSASPAAGASNVVLAAGVPAQALPRDIPAQAPKADALQAGAALGGGPIAFPDLMLPQRAGSYLTGAGLGGGAIVGNVVLAGPTGPVYGSSLLGSDMAGSAGFIRPVNAPELSGFGPRIHPVLGRAMFHTGIDLGAACSTPIRAAADGTVIYAAKNPSWGNRVIIAHSPTLKTAYGHQSQMLVKTGDVVKQGQVIGLVGTTGWSTGCHLHFDVILDNQYVDPAPYLGLAGSSAAAVPFFAPAPGSPGDTSGPAGPKNANPPVQDGDVPIAAATKKPVKPSTKPTTASTPSRTPSSTTTGSIKPTTPTPGGSTSTTTPPTTTPASPTTTTAPPTSTTPTTPPTTTTTTTTTTSKSPSPSTTSPTTSTTSSTSTSKKPDSTSETAAGSKSPAVAGSKSPAVAGSKSPAVADTTPADAGDPTASCPSPVDVLAPTAPVEQPLTPTCPEPTQASATADDKTS